MLAAKNVTAYSSQLFFSAHYDYRLINISEATTDIVTHSQLCHKCQ